MFKKMNPHLNKILPIRIKIIISMILGFLTIKVPITTKFKILKLLMIGINLVQMIGILVIRIPNRMICYKWMVLIINKKHQILVLRNNRLMFNNKQFGTNKINNSNKNSLMDKHNNKIGTSQFSNNKISRTNNNSKIRFNNSNKIYGTNNKHLKQISLSNKYNRKR